MYMKKKRRVFLQKSKLDNALYNLSKYIFFLENVFFVLFCLALLIGSLMVILGILQNDYYLLRVGVLVLVFSAAAYFFLGKPVLLVLYALCKVLINTENPTEK